MTVVADWPDFNRRIREFWAWASNSLGRLSSDELHASIDRWMDVLEVPSWEVGPIDGMNMYLAISPAGDAEQYEKTKYIVSQAPPVEGWNFLPARPKRLVDWNRVLLWGIHGSIDANGWKVVPYVYPDGMTELVFFDQLLPALERDEKSALVASVICAEIGEDLLMRKVCLIDFERNPTPEMISGAIPISELEKLAW